MTHKEIEKYILSKPGSWLDYPFGAEAAVYKVGPKDSGKMFALIAEGKVPVQISLKCDPLLAVELRKKFASVMPGYHLNKKHWNTIIVTKKWSESELFELIDHSYNLVTGLIKPAS